MPIPFDASVLRRIQIHPSSYIQIVQEKPSMKPFNLEAAKAGAKLVTRDGREVESFAHFPTVPSRNENVRFAVGGRIISCDEGGRYIGPGEHSCHDLFMAPVTRTVYVNFWRDSTGDLRCIDFPSESAAKGRAEKQASAYPWIAVSVPVTIEQ